MCQGLRSNSTLKHLSLSYCSIGHTDDLKSSSSSGSTQNNSETGCHTQQLLRCGQALGDLLGNVKSSLEILNLSGNRVNGRILHLLCVRGLQPNNILKQLDLSDNEIDGKVDSLTLISSFLFNYYEISIIM